jgi:hypothetical protein
LGALRSTTFVFKVFCTFIQIFGVFNFKLWTSSTFRPGTPLGAPSPRRPASAFAPHAAQGHTPPEPHLPQTHAPRGASFSSSATRHPPSAPCARAERNVGPSAVPHADRGHRRTTAASSPSSGRHRQACAIFKAVDSPRACAKTPPLLPLHRARHCRPSVNLPLHGSTVLSNRHELLPRFPTSLCRHPLLGSAPPPP